MGAGRSRGTGSATVAVAWRRRWVTGFTASVCEAAAALADVIGARTLDALHLGAAKVVGGGALPLVTFELRQAAVARALGWVVLGG